MNETVLVVNLFPRVHGGLVDTLRAHGVRVLTLDRQRLAGIEPPVPSVLSDDISSAANDALASAADEVERVVRRFSDEIVRKATAAGFSDLDEDRLRSRLGRFLPSAASFAHACAAAIARFEPKLIISGNEFTPESRMAFALANRSGITSLHVEHGIRAAYTFLDHHSADVNAVICRESLKRLQGRGGSRQALVGNPAWDGLYRHLAAENPFPKLLPRGLKPVLLAWTWFDPGSSGNYWRSLSEPLRVLENCFEMLRARPEYGLVVKLHPLHMHYGFGTSGWFGRKIAESGLGDRIAVVNTDAEALLRHCFCALVYGSGLGVEAMICGAPAIDIHPRWHDRLFLDRHPVLKATEFEELMRLLELLEDEGYRDGYVETMRRLARDFNYDGDGKAGERLENLVLYLLGKAPEFKFVDGQ